LLLNACVLSAALLHHLRPVLHLLLQQLQQQRRHHPAAAFCGPCWTQRGQLLQQQWLLLRCSWA
jgi:bacterioferritin-associated ferredoxin